jgi:hypothetical protein
MAIKTFKAKVRIKTPKGSFTHQALTVQADNATNAKAMLEAQYGKGCCVIGPIVQSK